MKIYLNELIRLLDPIAIKGGVSDILIENFTDDSRKVNINSLFFAIKGVSNDGHNYVKEIEHKTAAAVVEHFVENTDCPQLLVKSTRNAFIKLLQIKYGLYLSDFSFVGITGTNGKTTFTYLMESILDRCGRRPAVIGTINYRLGNMVREATHTTPDLKVLMPVFKEFRERGCDTIVMEVSSHALAQRRLEGIKFDAACFSNLTPEHLDYHTDMEDYYRAKKLLFTDYLKETGVAVINSDDSYGRRLLNELDMKNKYGFSFRGDSDFNCRIMGNDEDQMVLEICVGDKKDVVKTHLKGGFNAYNVASAYITALLSGYDREKVKEGILSVTSVPGRLEEIKNELDIRVFVDYAHTPDALSNILKTVKELTTERLIVVFGCGGDRDKTKRAVMGKIACDYADVVVVTSDNPRTENPLAIIEDIKKGVDFSKEVIIEPDREKAIFSAIFLAKPKDTVVIAGKGHEDYQIIGKDKIHFSDQEMAKKALEKRRCLGQRQK